jgi:ferritin-like protein
MENSLSFKLAFYSCGQLYWRNMIKKKHLIDKLNKALDNEEEANDHFYVYTINSLKYYGWLSKDKKEKVKTILTKIKDDTQKHTNMIDNLINQIKESNKKIF